MSDSPWMTGDAASDYASNGARTKTGRRKFSPRYLAKQVREGNLQGARVGGRGELLYRREWIDRLIQDHATPVVVVPARRRA
jgi:hypothetical protein